MYLRFNVESQHLTRTDRSIVVARSENYLKAKFDFSPDWDGVTKTGVFTNGGRVYNVILDNDECFVPTEVIRKGCFTVSVFGGNLITADVVTIRVEPSGYEVGGSPEPPTPGVYEQVLGMFDKFRGGEEGQVLSKSSDEDLEFEWVEQTGGGGGGTTPKWGNIDGVLSNQTDLQEALNEKQNAADAFDGDYNNLTNKPSLFDGDYNSLTNKPDIPTVEANPTLAGTEENLDGIEIDGIKFKIPTASGATIDDSAPSTTKVFSSDKTLRDILKAKPQAEETMEQVLRNNEMAYKPSTTNYILLYVDDALPSLSDTWTLVHSYNVPLNVAVPTNHLDYTANNGQKIRELLHTMEDAGCEIHSHSTDENILTVNTTRAVAYERLKNSKELLMAEGYKVHGFCEPGGTGKKTFTEMGYDDLVRQFYLYSDTNIYPRGINQPRGSVSQSGVTISSLLGSIKKGQNARKFLFHAIGNDVTEAYLKEFIETAQEQGFVFTTEYEYYQKYAYAIIDDRLMKLEKAISTYKTYDNALFRLGLGKPSYDETAYPYALYYNSGDRRIIASDAPLIKDLTAQYVTFKKSDGTSFNYKKFKYSEGVWTQEASTSATSLNTSQNNNPTFSNYNVLDSNGGTVCAVADYYTY